MKYVLHEQGTAAWLAWRSGGIGGSDAPTVLGLSPFKTRERLLQEMTGQVLPEAPNYAMRRGTRLEGGGREVYEHRTGVVMQPVCCQHRDHEWMRASLDGISFDELTILEIKWQNWKAHALTLAGFVPEYHWPQIQHQLFVTGAARCHYWSCSDNAKFELADRYALVEVEPCKNYFDLLISEEGAFWKEVCKIRRKLAA